MKKSLIALAALAATASFAQSTVTLSGLMDLSYHSISGSGTTASTKLNSVSSSVGSATSAINFNVLEDLGGGLKAQAFFAFDPRANINNSAASIGRHEAYVGLSGGFGNLRLGAINTGSLSAYGAGSALGTATGSAYANIETASGGGVRFNNSLRYDTPSMNGFGVNLTYAPGNSDTTTAGAGAQPQVTDIGLSYANGPLVIAASSLKRGEVTGVQTAATPATQVGGVYGAAAVAATAESTYNTIGANYTMGAVKLFAGYGKSSGALVSEVNRFAATYTMGAVTLLGQYATTEIGTAAKRKATGVRADYALSKRTAAYAGYESYDSGATSANKINTMMVGVRHSF